MGNQTVGGFEPRSRTLQEHIFARWNGCVQLWPSSHGLYSDAAKKIPLASIVRVQRIFSIERIVRVRRIFSTKRKLSFFLIQCCRGGLSPTRRVFFKKSFNGGCFLLGYRSDVVSNNITSSMNVVFRGHILVKILEIVAKGQWENIAQARHIMELVAVESFFLPRMSVRSRVDYVFGVTYNMYFIFFHPIFRVYDLDE
jgi:hypothetical protein